MKLFIKLFLGIFIILSCSSEQKSDSIVTTDSTEVTDTTISYDETSEISTNKSLGKEFTKKYICPNHCKGSGSEKSGICSDCGMELIENPHLGY